MNVKRFLLVGSLPESLVNFRGPLLRELVEAGLEVHVAAPDLTEWSTTTVRLREMGVEVHSISLSRAGLNPLKDIISIYSLVRLMRRIRPTYFLGYTIKPVVYGSVAAALAGVKYRFALITGLGYTFTSATAERYGILQVVSVLYKYALRFSHKVFFQNSDDAALFESLGILKSGLGKSVVVNGSGVDIDYFSPQPFPSDIKFCLIARLNKSKGIREYVAAARRVREGYPSIVFGLAGWLDDNPDSVSEEAVRHWQAQGWVKFYGKVADVRPLLADTSVYILPSYREGMPRTVLEAMSMGRPVITTDVPGCRDTVQHGKNGFLIQKESVDGIVHSVLQFIEHPSLVEKMGKRSRELAEKKYDVFKVNAVMFEEMGLQRLDR